MKRLNFLLVSLAVAIAITLAGCERGEGVENDNLRAESVTEDAQTSTGEDTLFEEEAQTISLSDIPEYSGKAYTVVNGNTPFFRESDYTTVSFERYSELDAYGRCGAAFANIGVDIMPTEERGSIGSVKPSGWQTVRYESVDGKYLYNRCHLIGFQLAGENANEKNLITGTRAMNVDGMLPFENMVADYVKETNNHVLLRVTPMYEGNDLVAKGVLMEAYSVEDEGEGICFNVFCYNEQPGITIDHSNGDSFANDGALPYGSSETRVPTAENTLSYIANKNTKKFHYTSCASAKSIKESNRVYLECTREEAIVQGYEPCGNCKP